MRIVRMPGDGLCMFHSVGHSVGLPGALVKKALLEYQKVFSDQRMHLDDSLTVADWIRMDEDCLPHEYIQRLQSGYWGGTIDLVCLARLFHRDIHVQVSNAKKPLVIETSSPQCLPQDQQKKPITILYNGSNHYDAVTSL